MTREEAMQELFNNFKDLSSLFDDNGIDVPHEVIQAMAVSAFIQTHSNKNSHPASMPEGGIIKGTIEEKNVTTASNGNKRYALKVNGAWYSTFKPAIFGGKTFNEGDPIEFKVENQKGYDTIVEVLNVKSSKDIPF